ncbi:glycosyltransferase [Sorangium sp. So ce136]|uniref:glycosyltransferase n=1 Tax=Sorangium sp. So ce136 TaxID=3133284 RepID=UPI003F07EB5A
MKAVLAPVGSRGDVQPMLALGAALARAGHEVSLCVAENYRSSVEALGLAYVRGGEDAQHLMTRREVKVRGPLRFTKWGRLIEIGRIMVREQFAALEEAARGADLIVGTLLTTAAPSVAEHLGIPCFRACYFPASMPTADLPSIVFGALNGPPWFNRATWKVHALVDNVGLRALVNEYRVTRKLAPIEDVYAHASSRLTPLMAFDTEFAPLPGDFPAVHATGYWFLDSDEPLPADVEEFLAAGDAPVYVGFGSMPSADPAECTAAVLAAVRRAGCRALLSSGWAGIGEGVRDPRCKVIGAVHHAALFPRLSAVVHHGGAGTTAAALRAGVPQIIVPHMFDQHYWGSRVSASGLGPAPLKRRFSADALASAIRRTLGDTTMARRARAVAERVRASRGAQRAVEVLEQEISARAGARSR